MRDTSGKKQLVRVFFFQMLSWLLSTAIGGGTGEYRCPRRGATFARGQLVPSYVRLTREGGLGNTRDGFQPWTFGQLMRPHTRNSF